MNASWGKCGPFNELQGTWHSYLGASRTDFYNISCEFCGLRFKRTLNAS